MLIISCKNICKAYGINKILDNISFNINEGYKIGLIGQNGGGKSTLLKILTKEIPFDSGELFINKSKTIGYLNQNSNFDENLSIYENALLSFSSLLNMEKRITELENILSSSQNEELINEYTELINKFKLNGGYDFKAETLKVLNNLKFDENKIYEKAKFLSGGEKKRLDLAKLLLKKPDIILLDEPTNHLDLDSIEWLENYLKSYKGTLIVISHDRYFLDKIVTQIYELENSNILIFNSNYSKFLKLKEQYIEEQQHKYNLQQKFIEREEAIIKQFKQFNREKSIKAAESRQKKLDKIELMDSPSQSKKIQKIQFNFLEQSGNDVLEIKNLSKSFGDKNIFENINLKITKNQKIAIIGHNGVGKTTFFKILCEKEQKSSGDIIVGKGLNICYYDQEQSDLDPNKTIFEEIRDSFPSVSNQIIRRHLSNFLFKNDDIYKKISLLSGGEKCRINIIKIILSNSNVLFMDEPTNHLDIYSREILEKAIIDFEGTAIIISHDRYFLNKVVNKIYEFKNNGLNEYLGNYDYYINKKQNPDRFDSNALDDLHLENKKSNDSKPSKQKLHEKSKKAKDISKKISKLELSISSTEEKILELQNLLTKEDIYSDYQKISEINDEIKTLNNELSNMYDEWEKLV